MCIVLFIYVYEYFLSTLIFEICQLENLYYIHVWIFEKLVWCTRSIAGAHELKFHISRGWVYLMTLRHLLFESCNGYKQTNNFEKTTFLKRNWGQKINLNQTTIFFSLYI